MRGTTKLLLLVFRIIIFIDLNFGCDIEGEICQCSITKDKIYFKVECSKSNSDYSTFPYNLSILVHASSLLQNELIIKNKIYEHLGPNLFQNYSIETLELTNNEIRTIDNEAFETINNLSQLILKRNFIKQINFISKSLNNLTKLDLNDNELQLVDDRAFDRLANLYELDLSDNSISLIEQDAFVRLKKLGSLKLHLNSIENLAPRLFRSQINLVFLNLKDNLIKNLDPESFYGLKRLYDIQIGFNLIKHLYSDNFIYLNGLKNNLELSSQNIMEIDEFAFRNLANLTNELDLSSNVMTKLRNNTFYGLDSLNLLKLSHNKISYLNVGSFSGLKSLVHLELSSNNLFNLEPIHMRPIPHLKFLNLSQNLLRHLANSTFSSNLKFLFLDANKFQFVKREYFSNLIHLKLLSMKSNQISYIEEKSFNSLKSLEQLHLSDNCLNALNKNVFKNLKNLEHLDLSQNLLNSLDKDIFHDLKNLQNLYLSSNKLSFLDKDVLSSLEKLFKLDLSDNYFKTISGINFDNCKDLTEIYLDDNLITSGSDLTARFNYVKELFLTRNAFDFIEINPWFRLVEILDLNHNKNLMRMTFETDFDDLEPPVLKELRLKNTSVYFIQSIKFELFQELKKLDLSHNLLGERLVRILPNKITRNLHELNLAKTSLEFSPKFLYEAWYMNVIDLRGNRLNLTEIFMQNSRELIQIYLSETHLTSLNYLNFSLFPRLFVLDLSRNFLTLIKRDTFLLNYKLKQLNLSYNFIRLIEPKSFFYTDFDNLDLSHNRIQNFSDTHLRKEVLLNDFRINNNMVEKIDFKFTLNRLGSNKLTNVPVFTSQKLRVQEIHLSNNSLRIITNQSFDSKNKNLHILDLSKNLIENIESRAFFYLIRLLKLDLSENHLRSFDANLFDQLFSLQHLNISHNFLEVIHKGLFKNLYNLLVLDLANNPFLLIEGEAFKFLGKLSDLNIRVSSSGHFRINSSNIFLGLVSIKNLQLSSNAIDTFMSLIKLRDSFKPKIHKTLGDLIYYQSIFIQSSKATDSQSANLSYYSIHQDCLSVIYIVRFGLNLNLKSEEQVKLFLDKCQIYFMKSYYFFLEFKNKQT